MALHPRAKRKYRPAPRDNVEPVQGQDGRTVDTNIGSGGCGGHSARYFHFSRRGLPSDRQCFRRDLPSERQCFVPGPVVWVVCLGGWADSHRTFPHMAAHLRATEACFVPRVAAVFKGP